MAFRIEGTVLPDGGRREIFVEGRRFVHRSTARGPCSRTRSWCRAWSTCMPTCRWRRRPRRTPPRANARWPAAGCTDAGVCLVREPGSPDGGAIGLGPDDGVPRVLTAGRFLAPPALSARVRPRGRRRRAARCRGGRAARGRRHVGQGDRRLPARAAADHPHLHRRRPRRGCTPGARSGWPDRDPLHAARRRPGRDRGGLRLPRARQLPPARPVEAAARAGVAWVPTLSIDAGVRGMVRAMGLDAAAVREVDAGLDRQPEVLRAAAAAGRDRARRHGRRNGPARSGRRRGGAAAGRGPARGHRPGRRVVDGAVVARAARASTWAPRRTWSPTATTRWRTPPSWAHRHSCCWTVGWCARPAEPAGIDVTGGA